MPKARLGVALLVPPPLDAEVQGLRRAVGDGSLRRIPPHLTLVPPVNVAEARLDDASAVVRDAAAAAPPMTLELGPPATFLPDNPVLYLSVGGDLGPVHALREAVLREPLARTITWPFVPHVTLADEAGPDVIEAALTALGRYRVHVRFDRVHLLREGPGRVWEPIAEAPLRPPAVIGRGGLPLELTVTDHLDVEAAAFAGDRPRTFAVTARRAGGVVGTAGGHVSGDIAFLTHLSVDAAQRRQGIGSHLLAAVESLAAERGCQRVEAEVPIGTPGEALLRGRGWANGASSTVRLCRLLVGG